MRKIFALLFAFSFLLSTTQSCKTKKRKVLKKSSEYSETDDESGSGSGSESLFKYDKSVLLPEKNLFRDLLAFIESDLFKKSEESNDHTEITSTSSIAEIISFGKQGQTKGKRKLKDFDDITVLVFPMGSRVIKESWYASGSYKNEEEDTYILLTQGALDDAKESKLTGFELGLLSKEAAYSIFQGLSLKSEAPKLIMKMDKGNYAYGNLYYIDKNGKIELLTNKDQVKN